jgi:ribose 5-phosphate isomerase
MRQMMEAVTAILGVFCVGIFVAHAVDAYLIP